MMRYRPILLAFLIACPQVAFAEDFGAKDALSAALMFIHCIQDAGDSNGLRDWAVKAGLHQASEDIAKLYLDEKPGQLFGIKVSSGELSLASQDDGGCTVFADHADAKLLRSSIEAWLNTNDLIYPPPQSLVRTNGDTTLTSTNYEVTGRGRRWRVVVSTGTGGRFEAIMTAYGTPPTGKEWPHF